MSGPTIDLADFDQFCANRMGPSRFQGLFTAWLTSHFDSADKIQEPSLKSYVWTDDYTTTNILIDSATRWNPQLVEKRPAIIIKRGNITNNRLGIDDRLMGGTNLGPQYYVTFWQGNHVLFCIGSSGMEAELIAEEVLKEIHEFASKVARRIGIFKLKVQQIGEVHKLEEAKENFVVPIIVEYAFSEEWQITPHAPVINGINLSFFF